MTYTEKDRQRFLETIKANDDKINHRLPIDWRLKVNSQSQVNQNFETIFNNDVTFNKNTYFNEPAYFSQGGIVIEGGFQIDELNFEKSILKVEPSDIYTTGIPTDLERIDAMTLKCKQILHIHNNDFYNWSSDVTYNSETYTKDYIILDKSEIETNSSGAGTLVFIKNNSNNVKYIMGADNEPIEIGNGVSMICVIQYDENDDEYYVDTFSRSFGTNYDTFMIV